MYEKLDKITGARPGMSKFVQIPKWDFTKFMKIKEKM